MLIFLCLIGGGLFWGAIPFLLSPSLKARKDRAIVWLPDAYKKLNGFKHRLRTEVLNESQKKVLLIQIKYAQQEVDRHLETINTMAEHYDTASHFKKDEIKPINYDNSGLGDIAKVIGCFVVGMVVLSLISNIL
ncbi:MAG: hypothetical protein ACRCZ0_12015 [Cetobacterium sp.]